MSESFEVRYNGTENLIEKHKAAIGAYKYIGARKDCKDCRGVFALFANDWISLIKFYEKAKGEGEYTGWRGTVKFDFFIFQDHKYDNILFYSIIFSISYLFLVVS